MPSPRVIITIIGAIAGLASFFAARGKYPSGSSWPLGWAMAAFILIYVLGNILWGVAQGMREASAKRSASGGQEPPRPPAAR